METCPVFVEHVPKIVDMRRFLVMEEGRLSDAMQQAMRCLEGRGHPFPGNAISRLDWCDGLDIRALAAGDSTDCLYWVGCSTALNARNHRTARAFARILREAGVDFAILGNDEHCTGDPARRIGNEYLFQAMARRNISTLESRKFRRIVTTCPHCFNAFKNEYPQIGATFEVYHHTQLIADLIATGRWRPADKLADIKVTYHDPCYLGRYNDIYSEPRAAIGAVAETSLVEMPRHREGSFCCGAGGGRMWADEPREERVSNLRAQEALATEAGVLTVACPFCMTMLEEAVTFEQGARKMEVIDIAELLGGAATS
jgi:Fe-S oxidoreductase